MQLPALTTTECHFVLSLITISLFIVSLSDISIDVVCELGVALVAYSNGRQNLWLALKDLNLSKSFKHIKKTRDFLE